MHESFSKSVCFLGCGGKNFLMVEICLLCFFRLCYACACKKGPPLQNFLSPRVETCFWRWEENDDGDALKMHFRRNFPLTTTSNQQKPILKTFLEAKCTFIFGFGGKFSLFENFAAFPPKSTYIKTSRKRERERETRAAALEKTAVDLTGRRRTFSEWAPRFIPTLLLRTQTQTRLNINRRTRGEMNEVDIYLTQIFQLHDDFCWKLLQSNIMPKWLIIVAVGCPRVCLCVTTIMMTLVGVV